MNITLKITHSFEIKDLRQKYGKKIFLLQGEHVFTRMRHPQNPSMICYIWRDGVCHGLRAGLSEDFLVNLWEHGLPVDWNNFAPSYEEYSTAFTAA